MTDVIYGGAAARSSVPVSEGGRYALDGRGRGQLGVVGSPGDSVWRRLGLHALTLGAVAAGGALTGYLAAGTRKGVIVGSATHLALFGVAVGAFGSQFSMPMRATYGALAVANGVGIGYLLWSKRRSP